MYGRLVDSETLVRHWIQAYVHYISVYCDIVITFRSHVVINGSVPTLQQ